MRSLSCKNGVLSNNCYAPLHLLALRMPFWNQVCLSVHQHIGSDTITWVVFNVQLSYSYIDAGWREEGTYTVWGQMVKGQGHFWTLSTLWFWHNSLSSFQRTPFIFYTYMQDGERKIPIHVGVKRSKPKVTTEICQHYGSDTITWVVFNIQLSYFINRCRMVRGRYL